jgi:ABC-type sugar transport system permease subunit
VALTSVTKNASRGPATGGASVIRWWRRGLRKVGTPLALLAPTLVVLVLLRLAPILDAVRLAFTEWDGFSSPRWIGLANFERQLHDERLHASLLNNFKILVALPVWIFLPYVVAFVLYRKPPGWRFFRFAFFLPVVLSPVVIGVYYGLVLHPDGALNEALRALGLGGLAREWLNDPVSALPIVIAIIIWSTFGVGVLLFMSGLANLDQEQIDAARVDGANTWQLQRYVIFWQLLPVVEFWAIIMMIASFTAFFPLIFSLTNGGPGHSTYTVDFDIYQEAFRNGDLGYASSLGVTLLLIVLLIAALQLRVLRGRGSLR